MWFHDRFTANRLGGEWFDFDPDMLIETPPLEEPVWHRKWKSGQENNQSYQATVRLPFELYAQLKAREKPITRQIIEALEEMLESKDSRSCK